MPAVKDIDKGQGSPVNLVIVIPSGDYWLADFAISLMSLQQMLGYHPLSDEFQHNLINERGSLIHVQREHLAEKALDSGATHILWLDSDMKFPPNLVHLLFRHQLPIVACNYVKRSLPAMPNTKGLDHKLISTDRDSQGLVEAISAGFGAVLMTREVLETVERPWFDVVWVDKGDEIEPMGEDVFFFTKARKVINIPLFIDHDASKKVSHIGTFEYDNCLASATLDEIDMPEMNEKLMSTANKKVVIGWDR